MLNNKKIIRSNLFFVLIIFILVVTLLEFSLWIFLAVLSLAIFLWFYTKIEFNTDVINIRYFSKNTIINVSNIKEIIVVTTTPLISQKKDISQINWRDRIEIYYLLPNGQKAVAVVNVFVFSGFVKIINEILKIRSDLKITFSKATMWQNFNQM